MPAEIFDSISEMKKYIQDRYPDLKIYATSGGFDPMHVGHLRCLQGSASLADSDDRDPGLLVVIVNGDGFLHRKKGYSFMPHEERMEIIAGVDGVDFVTGWDDGSQTVTGAIGILQPDYFTKGGDRDASTNVPEFELCEDIGCEVLFNVGGGKVQSSSTLVSNARQHDKSYET